MLEQTEPAEPDRVYPYDKKTDTSIDIVAEFASFCFDASVIDLFAPLTAGAVLYILPESIRKMRLLLENS